MKCDVCNKECSIICTCGLAICNNCKVSHFGVEDIPNNMDWIREIKEMEKNEDI